MNMKTNVIAEQPMITLKSQYSDFKGGEGEVINIFAKDLKAAEIGEEWVADFTNCCGRGNDCESLKVVYKDDRGVAAVYRNWGTTNEDNPEDWEEEPQLLWFELA